MPGPGAIAPARDDTRARLLAAAVRVYAQHGYHGATTRLIAAEAGVNEVTLFRVFGSKDVLLDEAMATVGEPCAATALPEASRDPLRELARWCEAERVRLAEGRALMLKCFAESDDHPSHARRTAEGLDGAARELRAWVGRLAKAGLATAPRNRDAAVAMLLSALVTDAVARGEMGSVFLVPEDEAPRRYAALFLGAIGVSAGARSSASRAARGA